MIDRFAKLATSLPAGFICGWAAAQADDGNWRKMGTGLLVLMTVWLFAALVLPSRKQT